MPPDEPGVDQLWLWFWIWIWIWISQRDELRAKRRDRRPESRDGDGAESDDARSNDGNGDGAESDDAKSNDGDGDGARSDGARSNDGDGDGAESDDAESDDGAESDDAESDDAKSDDGDGAESSDGAERWRGVEQLVGDAVEAGQADGERFVGGGQAFGHGAAGDAKRGHRATRTALPRVSSAKHLVQRFLLQRWIVGERGTAATSSEPETSSSYPVD